MTHGVYATTPVLDCEDESAYRALADAYRKHFAPQGTVEECLLRQIVALDWKMRRIDKADAALFDQLLDTKVGRFTGSLDLRGWSMLFPVWTLIFKFPNITLPRIFRVNLQGIMPKILERQDTQSSSLPPTKHLFTRGFIV